jgi:HK97 gp10 family phage protein
MIRADIIVDVRDATQYITRFRQIDAAVSKAAGDVEAVAKASIELRDTQYRKYKRGKRRYHWSSAPGHPPNNDRGRLSNSIQHKRVGPNEYEVSAGAKYAIPLEVGTRKMAARPFMVPALMKVRPTLIAAVKSILRA